MLSVVLGEWMRPLPSSEPAVPEVLQSVCARDGALGQCAVTATARKMGSTDLVAVFGQQGLVVQDLVALSGDGDLLDARCELEGGLGFFDEV